MKYQKISCLLDNTTGQAARFRTKICDTMMIIRMETIIKTVK